MKGQITIFIILGLVIVAFAAALLIFHSRAQSYVSPDVTLARQGISDCVKSAGTDALLSVGEHGGRIYPVHKEWFFNSRYGYAVWNYSVIVPSWDDVGRDIESFVGTSVKVCAKAYVDSVSLSDLNVTVEENDTWVRGSYQAIVPQKSFSDGFAVKYDVRLGHILDGVRNYSDYSIGRDTVAVDSSEFNVMIMRLDNSNILYTLTDLNSTLDKEPYVFYFVLPGRRDIEGNPLFVESLSANLTVGQRFYHKLNYTGVNVSFDAVTPEFGIVDGVVDWTPVRPGNYSIRVIASDENNNYGSGLLEFDVK